MSRELDSADLNKSPSYSTNAYGFASKQDPSNISAVSSGNGVVNRNGVPTYLMSDIEADYKPVGTPSMFEDTWLKQLFSSHLNKSRDQGLSQLATPLDPDGVLREELKGVAEVNGMEYAEEDGHGIIRRQPGNSSAHGVFTDPSDTAIKIYEFRNDPANDDITDEELGEYLNVDVAAVMPTVDRIREGVEKEGFTIEEIKEYLSGGETLVVESNENLMPEDSVASEPAENFLGTKIYNPRERYTQALQNVMIDGKEINVVDYVANIRHLNEYTQFLGKKAVGLFDPAIRKQMQDIADQGLRQMIEVAAKEGLRLEEDPENPGKLIHINENGEPVPVEPGFFKGLEQNKGFEAGMIAGGTAGYVRTPVPHLGVKTLGGIGGAVVGGAAGSVYDQLEAANFDLQNINKEVFIQRTMTSAEQAAVFEVAGLLGIRVAGSLAEATGAKHALAQAYKFVKEGYLQRAQAALDNLEAIDPATRNEVLEQMERVAAEPAPANRMEQDIQIAVNTGLGNNIVDVASRMDVNTLSRAARVVDTRAKDVNRAADELVDDVDVEAIYKQINTLKGQTQDFYHSVRQKADVASENSDWVFEYKDLALNPLIERLRNNGVIDPTVNGQLYRKLNSMYMLGDPESRVLDEAGNIIEVEKSFSDLLELRKEINDFLYNKNMRKKKDKDMIFEVRNRIDDEIQRGAREIMPDGDQWLANFDEANGAYSAMKNVEKNAIMKVMMRNRDGGGKGVSTKAVVQALTKYAESIDGTFTDMMKFVPAKDKPTIENAVVRELSKKYTYGDAGSQQAVDFPQFAEALNNIEFVTPEAKKFRAAIGELAGVFKNDVLFGSSTGKIRLPAKQAYIASTFEGRIKQAAIIEIWHYMKRMVSPSDEAKMYALADKASKALKNPLQAKPMNELIEATRYIEGMEERLLDLRRATAEKVSKEPNEQAQIVLYGDGRNLTTAKRGQKHTIPPSLIANQADQSDWAEAMAVHSTDYVQLDKILKSEGFLYRQTGSESAVKLGD